MGAFMPLLEKSTGVRVGAQGPSGMPVVVSVAVHRVPRPAQPSAAPPRFAVAPSPREKKGLRAGAKRSDLAQRLNTKAWHRNLLQHLFQSAGAGGWRKGLPQEPGAGAWHRSLAQGPDARAWRKGLVQRPGARARRKSLAQGPGARPWPRGLAQGPGAGAWHRGLPQGLGPRACSPVGSCLQYATARKGGRAPRKIPGKICIPSAKQTCASQPDFVISTVRRIAYWALRKIQENPKGWASVGRGLAPPAQVQRERSGKREPSQGITSGCNLRG